MSDNQFLINERLKFKREHESNLNCKSISKENNENIYFNILDRNNDNKNASTEDEIVFSELLEDVDNEIYKEEEEYLNKLNNNKNIDNDNVYAVYAWCDPNRDMIKTFCGYTFTSEPFYIGISNNSSRRHNEHLRESERNSGSNVTKNYKIQELKIKGTPAVFKILETDLSQEESYQIESNLINAIGRWSDSNFRGPLVNIRPGIKPPDHSFNLTTYRESKLIDIKKYRDQLLDERISLEGSISELPNIISKLHDKHESMMECREQLDIKNHDMQCRLEEIDEILKRKNLEIQNRLNELDTIVDSGKEKIENYVKYGTVYLNGIIKKNNINITMFIKECLNTFKENVDNKINEINDINIMNRVDKTKNENRTNSQDIYHQKHSEKMSFIDKFILIIISPLLAMMFYLFIFCPIESILYKIFMY